MRIRLLLFAGTAFAFIGPLRAGTLELQPKETVPPTITHSEPWQFTIAVPGLMPGFDGTIGVRGVNANLDIGFDQILQHLDMVFAMRAEARKGPFGIFSEILYLGLSDNAQVGGLINDVHEQVDQTLVDVGLSWRLINQPRWFVDFAAGTHCQMYTAAGGEIGGFGVGADLMCRSTACLVSTSSIAFLLSLIIGHSPPLIMRMMAFFSTRSCTARK
jgi:hypothetical protein